MGIELNWGDFDFDFDFDVYAEVPGVPVIGNLLQLKEKKPHKTFTKWAETYGPVYSIRTGATTMVVLNNNDVAKEVNQKHLSLRITLFFLFGSS